MRSFLGRHRLAGAAAVAGGLAVAAWVAFGWFGVQGLWVDDEVDEAAPVFDSGATVQPVEDRTDASADGPPTATTTPPTIVNLGTGRFISRSHTTEGVATVLGDGSPQRFL